MHGIPIYYAIYFRLLNRWVLVNKQSLIERDKKYETSIISAMAKNEMAILGDLSIGTKPALSIELISDSNQEVTRKDNEIKFIIGGVKLYCDGKEITNELDKKIAYYLIRFGDWNCGEPNIISGDDKFRSIRYEFSPEEDEEQGFNMIGTLSSMITTEFNEKTIYEKSVIALDTNLDPSLFSVKIPPDYYGEDLPLWIFSLKPNHEFKEPSL
ncbi:hypothetical protein [Enterobacter roggenkampii]|uniref:hypothetical protein n=2 Tax=Enterobacteriaceae TaxID=543 RepID=UPI00267FF735